MYWFSREFLGSRRMRTKASSSRAFSAVMTGIRPTSSGIRPYFTKSWGVTSFIQSIWSSSFLPWTSPPKPREPEAVLRWTIFSRPSKAPPQINRMLEVLMLMASCWGCLRPPLGGTLATVPSRIFSSACCTPSPLTSRVMDWFSDFREILSISSM